MVRISLTWMLCLKVGQVIDIFIHDDPQVIGLLVRGNGIFGEGFGHDGFADYEVRNASGGG